MGFFDGAAAKNIGGAGFILFLNKSHSIHFSMGCGMSTNTKYELMALWALLFASNIMGIPLHSVFGDSLVIITWASGNCTLNIPHLTHWCDEVKDLLLLFPDMNLKHIYREHNQMADSLSKSALSLDLGFEIFQEHLLDMNSEQGNFQFY